MPTFPSKRFIPTSIPRSSLPLRDRLAALYRLRMHRHPFLLFGLPFILTMVAGSFFLTPATALRYERHDRKVKQLTRTEELGLRSKEGKAGRGWDINEEYYRLAAKDLDDWENKRVMRLKGERDGVS